MIRIGCCGFSMAQDDYFASFDSIEIQKTFYHPPRPSTAEKWRAKTKKDFVFTLKAWQAITHYPSSPTYRRSRLGDDQKQQCGGFQPTDMVWEAWDRTREIAEILDAPAIVFQCPASLDPNDEHIANIRRFFSTIDRADFILGWEPRGEWPDETIAELCKELDLVHVVDPFKNVQLHGNVNYFRLHGKTGYRYEYTDEDLQEMSRMIDRDTAYCMFNNISMDDDARRFVTIVEDSK